MIIYNKFQNFPKVYYISHEKFVDRHENINSILRNRNIDYVPVIITHHEDSKLRYYSAFPQQNEDQAIKVTAGHLKAIKKWLDSDNSETAIFFEDDISFDTVDYWHFSFNEFMSRVPEDWDCVQLLLNRSNFDDSIFQITERRWDDWAITAYILKRDYAERLVSQFYISEDLISLILPHPYDQIIGIPENIIYLLGKTYSFPLFVESMELSTTFSDNQYYINDNQIENHNGILHKTNHKYSHDYVLTWWKKQRPL